MTIEMAFIISEKKIITERKIYHKKKYSVTMAQASDKWKEKMKKDTFITDKMLLISKN